MSSIYTDLAMELKELDPDMNGISETEEHRGEIAIKRVGIITKEAAEKVNKAIGKYITIDAPDLAARPLDLFNNVEKCLSDELRSLIRFDINKSTALVVGLGNQGITPDSLGPKAAEKVFVTRHIKGFAPDAFDFELPSVCSIAPGVLGVTGVETADIVRGVVSFAKPDYIIAIDSLASRRASRISSIIQLSDAGISPGSGVGNLRSELSKASLGVPVIAIGVPLVVRASTITRDTISTILKESLVDNSESMLDELESRIIEKSLDDMIVTPKDIDIIVEDMSRIIANAINSALFGENVEKIREMIA